MLVILIKSFPKQHFQLNESFPMGFRPILKTSLFCQSTSCADLRFILFPECVADEFLRSTGSRELGTHFLAHSGFSELKL